MEEKQYEITFTTDLSQQTLYDFFELFLEYVADGFPDDFNLWLNYYNRFNCSVCPVDSGEDYFLFEVYPGWGSPNLKTNLNQASI